MLSETPKENVKQSNLSFPPYSQPAPVEVIANTHFGGCTQHLHNTHRGRPREQLLNGDEQSNSSALTTVVATQGGSHQALLKNPT